MSKPYLDQTSHDALRQKVIQAITSLDATIARLEALEARMRALEAQQRVVSAHGVIPVFPVGWNYDDLKGWSQSPEGTP